MWVFYTNHGVKAELSKHSEVFRNRHRVFVCPLKQVHATLYFECRGLAKSLFFFQ